MQAELIKEERIDGTVVYYTKMDGIYVSDSLSFQKDKAEECYNRIVTERSNRPKQTVLRTHRITQDAVEQVNITDTSCSQTEQIQEVAQ